MSKSFIVKHGLAVNTASPTVTVHFETTDAMRIPVGNTANRPAGADGHFRYNSETGEFEGYSGGDWGRVAPPSSGGFYKGNDGAFGDPALKSNLFRINANTLTSNVTIEAGENAQAAGPITIANGVQLTIEDGAFVSIV
jgi:hypothetical protein